MLWPVASGDSLPVEAVERLAPYITRYGQTLGCTVTAVGGADDHLHVLFELPHDKTVARITDELQRASARFVRESYGAKLFAWGDADAMSISPENVETVAAYVRENAARHDANDLLPSYEGDPGEMAAGDDETPDWLREALDFRRGEGD
jgi:REP element-mobilizing transposase RayT